MIEVCVPTFHIEKASIPDALKANNIRINDFAELFMAHPHFSTEGLPTHFRLVICTLAELGFPDGAVLEDIIARADAFGLGLCHISTGFFFRLAYTHQPESREHVLSGTHRSPDGAVIVSSETPEPDDAFPKGLYLRNVDGQLWLRGYVCDQSYRWSADDVFAFQRQPDILYQATEP